MNDRELEGPHGVIPVAAGGVALDVDGRELRVGDFEFCWVLVPVQVRVDLRTGGFVVAAIRLTIACVARVSGQVARGAGLSGCARANSRMI